MRMAKYFKVHIRSFSNGLTNLDVLENIKLPWPSDPNRFINFRYYDSGAKSKNSEEEEKHEKIILATHGSPGSHKDFKYMIPNLVSEGFRVIAINWPGYGITGDPPDKINGHMNATRAELLNSFCKAISLKKIDAVIGHSAGCYPLPLLFSKQPENYSRAFFIAPGSATPYRAIRPYWFIQLLDSMLRTKLRAITCRITYFLTTTFLGFKYSHFSHAGTLVQVVANIDFPTLNLHISQLKRTKSPSIFILAAEKDAVVEIEKSLEYAERLECEKTLKIPKTMDDVTALSKILYEFPGGEKGHKMVVFDGEGHFLQKHRAAVICGLISEILNKKMEKISSK